MKRWTKIALATAVLAGVGACGGDEQAGGPAASPTPTATRLSSTARVKILQPTPGAVVTGSEYTVKVQVTGARILVEASTDVRADTGHMHLSLDGKSVTILAGLEYRLTGLTPGRHLLQAEFAAADHGPFNPRVIDTVTFTVA